MSKHNFDKIFVVSDHHLGHERFISLPFKDKQGNVIRPFKNLDEMHHKIITSHNSVIKDDDKVYFLGDVAFDLKAFHEVMPQLKGVKNLILGNHDHYKMSVYQQYFKDIYSSRTLKFNDKFSFFLCHYPVHPECNAPKYPLVVHGHTHQNMIYKREEFSDQLEIDKFYYNVSVEVVDYTPVKLADIAKEYGHVQENQKEKVKV